MLLDWITQNETPFTVRKIQMHGKKGRKARSFFRDVARRFPEAAHYCETQKTLTVEPPFLCRVTHGILFVGHFYNKNYTILWENIPLASLCTRVSGKHKCIWYETNILCKELIEWKQRFSTVVNPFTKHIRDMQDDSFHVMISYLYQEMDI